MFSRIWTRTCKVDGLITEEIPSFEQTSKRPPTYLSEFSLIWYLQRYIRLTSERPSQRGWLFSRLPLTATNWEVRVRAIFTLRYHY